METYRAHCLILPFPIQGHINPMLQFAKRLQYEGTKITFATTKFLFETVDQVTGSISVETISDGYDEGANGIVPEIYLPKFQKVGSETLTELILKLQDSGCPVDCIIYDSFLPWCLDVAKDLGVCVGVFFTQSCAVNNIYYHVHKGLLKLPLEESEVHIPGLPPLPASDLPSFVSNPGPYPASSQLVVHDQMEKIEEADWIFFNTFYRLKEEVNDWMGKILPVKTIGPTIPSMYLEKRLEDDKQYGLNLFKPMSNACMSWLSESEEALEYLKLSYKLVRRLLEILIGNFGVTLDDSKLESLIGNKIANMNFHPICPNPELTVGVGRHSDMSILTVLLQDDVGCLYVKLEEAILDGRKEEWIEIPPIAGALVINAGDSLQILSNGRYKSAEHGVLTTSKQSRVSIPLFSLPRPTEKIGPLPHLAELDLWSSLLRSYVSRVHEQSCWTCS